MKVNILCLRCFEGEALSIFLKQHGTKRWSIDAESNNLPSCHESARLTYSLVIGSAQRMGPHTQRL
jgi:hypothetical protein